LQLFRVAFFRVAFFRVAFFRVAFFRVAFFLVAFFHVCTIRPGCPRQGLYTTYYDTLEERKKRKLSKDVLIFGHILFEMATGEALSSALADEIPPTCSLDAAKILQAIFAPKKAAPTLEDLLLLPERLDSARSLLHFRTSHARTLQAETSNARCNAEMRIGRAARPRSCAVCQGAASLGAS
jgi:hypothetical protein